MANGINSTLRYALRYVITKEAQKAQGRVGTCNPYTYLLVATHGSRVILQAQSYERAYTLVRFSERKKGSLLV